MKSSNSITRLLTILPTLICVVGLVPGAFAEPLTKDSLVKALKAKGPSRAIQVKKQALNQQHRALIKQLAKKTTRAISVEERKQLAKIVEETKRPSIDLEILFDYNSAAIRPKSMPTVIKLGQALSDKALKGATFLVAGHTDAKGGNDYNLTLSQARARAVKDFLVTNFGLNGTKLVAVGYGEEELKHSDQPEAAENRRVQITNLVQ